MIHTVTPRDQDYKNRTGIKITAFKKFFMDIPNLTTKSLNLLPKVAELLLKENVEVTFFVNYEIL